MQKTETVCPHCQAVNRLDSDRIAAQPNCGRCHESLFDGVPVALDDDAFRRMIAREQLPVVVDFWAAWCGPCKSMAPVFASTAEDFRFRARFAKLDVDRAPQASAAHDVRSIPTLIVFKAARPVARTSGAMTANALRSWVESQL